MKRFHIALAVKELEASITEYTTIFGQKPTVIVTDKYAMWRTDLLNFSINQMPERAGQLRHLGFEDSTAQGHTSRYDCNGIEWELFSASVQDEKILEVYGIHISA